MDEIRTPGDDVARMEALFRRNYRDIAAYVRRRAEPDVVDDVVAETFLVAWRRLHEVPLDARPWLVGVARKTLATRRRSMARQRSLTTKLETVQSRIESEEEESSGLDVADALKQLSEEDREAITLVAWEGLSPNEAALAVGQSGVAFRVRLHRAKRRLRQRLEARQLAAENRRDLASELAMAKGVKR